MSATLPSGTVTFLFTDIEGSTRLWEDRPDEMRSALAEHDMVVRGAIEDHGGHVFSTGGDGFAAAFQRADAAVSAATKAQAVLALHPFLRVRMGINTGEVHERGGDYFGPPVNRTARLMGAGHGGQVVVSAATAAVVGTAGLVDLGVHRLVTLGLVHEGTVLTAAVAGGQIAARTLSGKELAVRRESQDLARQQLGDDAYAAAVATGSAMTPEAAIAFAVGVADRLSAPAQRNGP